MPQLYKIRPVKSYTICTKMKFIYLHISGVDEKFSENRGRKKSLAALAIYVKIALFSNPIKPHAAGIIAKLHGIGFAGGIAQAGADGREQGVFCGAEDAVAAHGAEGHEGQAEFAAEGIKLNICAECIARKGEVRIKFAFGQGGIAESERGALLYQRHIVSRGKQALAHYAKRRGRSINR